MEIEIIENICFGLAHVESEIKWKSDLVFMIARKMFCVVDLDSYPNSIAFKVPEEDFEELAATSYFKPAPYFAQHSWVTLTEPNKIPIKDLQDYIRVSYELVKGKLSKKALLSLDENKIT